MAAAQTRAALAADRVDLINKDDGRGDFFRLVEQIADAGRAHAYIQLHKIGAGNAEEGDARLTRHGTCKQGFTIARRAYKYDAFGDSCAQFGEFLRVF